MNYPALCETLVREFGVADVFDKRHPDLGAPNAEQASLVLWEHDGVFAVGGVDRGEFTTTYEFPTESEACAYMLDAVRRNAQVADQTPSERRAARAVTDEVTADLLKEFGAPGRGE